MWQSRALRGRVDDWSSHAAAVGVVALCTVVAWLAFPHLGPSSLTMVYLLAVVLVAARFGRGPSVLASVLSVAAFDFFFVPPYLTLRVADTQYLVTFAVMLGVALVIGTLTVRIRQQADSAGHREQRTAALYAMSRELASLRGVDDLVRAAARHIGKVFASEVGVFLPGPDGRLVPRADPVATPGGNTSEEEVTRWVYEQSQTAGLWSATLPGRTLYLPLVASRGTIGVLGVRPAQPQAFAAPEQRHLLETFVAQTALAIERAMLAEEAHGAQLKVESERLRNALLSSVSHDLRTPLATITGAASGLLEETDRLDAAARRELLHAIHEEADRLNRLVNNLLDMTRLEAGAVQVRKDWHPMEELVGAALARVGGRLQDRPVMTRLPPDLPLVPLDGVLMEQVLINLLDNVIKHTPPGSPIEIAAVVDDGHVRLEVADRGPGLSPGDETRVFEKFYQAELGGTGRGVGLGLTICRGIVEAHGGRITAENRAGGGLVFRVVLPLQDKPPEIRIDDA